MACLISPCWLWAAVTWLGAAGSTAGRGRGAAADAGSGGSPSRVARVTWLARPGLVPNRFKSKAGAPSRTGRGRSSSLSRAYLAGGADQEATAAGDAATGFDFGDAAHMAAELAPMLGGAPAGQRGR